MKITKELTKNKGITLIALVVTIVLNCSSVAMELIKKIKNIEKIDNLLYNIIM